jgi:hypothetical protein
MRFRKNVSPSGTDASTGVAAAPPLGPELTVEERANVRIIATQLAMRGRTREEAAAYLKDVLGVGEPDAVINEIYPSAA